MGGKLEVQSTPGEGAEFFFTLPFAYASDEDDKLLDTEPPDALPDLTGKRVLVAEDNDLNREIAESLLQMNGLVVETARDGKEAAERFSSTPPGYFDAVLMDIRMPRMDGLTAARLIRTMEKPDSRTIPIIAMTANAFDEDTRKSLENGMNGHLSKPIEMDKVLETLGRCIKSSGGFKL